MTLNPMLEEKAKALTTLNRRIFRLRNTLTNLEEERRVLKKEYSQLDRDLALVDGRMTKSRVAKSPKSLEVKLTKEQILNIIKALGN